MFKKIVWATDGSPVADRCYPSPGLGSHGQGAVAGLFLGSFTVHLLKVAPCPVLVVPPACHPAAGHTRRTPHGSPAQAPGGTAGDPGTPCDPGREQSPQGPTSWGGPSGHGPGRWRPDQEPEC